MQLLVSASADPMLITSLVIAFDESPLLQFHIDLVAIFLCGGQAFGLLINGIKTPITMYDLTTFTSLNVHKRDLKARENQRI
jgi:hypothetical protein